MTQKYENLFTDIGYKFNDIKLLEEAFTHNSVGKNRKTYQRLEFLGDRVLSLVIAEMVFKNFPDEQEGDLAKRHTSLVREESLAEVAKKINLSSYLIISPSEKSNLESPTILADSCEALLGAIYLEAGEEVVKNFINKMWYPMMESQISPPVDGKSALQEWAQSKGYSLPFYEVTDIKGLEHEPEFSVKVLIKETSEFGCGTGRTKKTAEQNAANDLLGKIIKND